MSDSDSDSDYQASEVESELDDTLDYIDYPSDGSDCEGS